MQLNHMEEVNKMSKVRMQRIVEDRIVGGKKINLESIQDALYNYEKYRVSRPEILTVSPYKRNELLSNSDIPPYMLNVKNIYGLEIIVDPNLNDDEWYVGNREVVIKELR